MESSAVHHFMGIVNVKRGQREGREDGIYLNLNNDICYELSYQLLKYLVFHVCISELIDKAFARIDLPEVVALKPLNQGLHVLEMFHGRTLAFKDLSTFVLGQLMSYFLQRKAKHITLLVGQWYLPSSALFSFLLKVISCCHMSTAEKISRHTRRCPINVCLMHCFESHNF